MSLVVRSPDGGSSKIAVWHGESTVEEPRIIDLMPTILTLLEEPIPDDIDGKPLNIFADIDLSSVTHRSPLETPKRGNEERNDVEKRLQELGYLN